MEGVMLLKYIFNRCRMKNNECEEKMKSLFSRRLPYRHGLRVRVIRGPLAGCYGALCGGSTDGTYEVDFGNNVRRFILIDWLVDAKDISKSV